MDTTSMNPKGHVKLELYDESGVFFTKEKKNLVVTSSNEIVANMMSNPAKTSRLRQQDVGDTPVTANENGMFVLELSTKENQKRTVSQDVLSTNTETLFNILDLKSITEILEVKVGEEILTVDEEVFLLDAQEGILEFKEAPKSPIQVKFYEYVDEQVSIIRGTEKVLVDGQEWKRGLTPNHADKVYAVNYKTGEVYFQEVVSKAQVTYDITKHYGLSFMGLGGKPEGHPENQPVSFSQTDKALTRMDNEFENARMPILYPAVVEQGKPELEVLPTKRIEQEDLVFTHTAEQAGADVELEVQTGNKKILEIISATKTVEDPNNQGETIQTDLIVDEDIVLNGNQVIVLRGEVAEGDTFEVHFKLQSNNLHLNYQLAMAPIVELVSVVHEDAATNTVTAYQIQDRGMRIGSGDVWMMNANAGVLQFSSDPSNGVPVHTPGQLTIEYKVNSGTVVKFTADFPKGVPGPVTLEKTDSFTSLGETTFILSDVVNKDGEGNFLIESVTRNGVDETFTVHPDGTRIDVDNVASGDIIAVTFKYSKKAHNIYQVAMFDEKDSTNSKMFNISGIGPVTKDENTGMRITWSVTF